MKIVNITKDRYNSKGELVKKGKTITLPSAFTMKELVAANPDISKNTLYQRLQSMLREGDKSPIKIVGDVKRGVKVKGEKSPVRTRGRTEIAYALVDASEGNNLIRQVKSQGIAKLKKQGIKQGVTVAKIGDSDEVAVPVITEVAPLPDMTVPVIT